MTDEKTGTLEGLNKKVDAVIDHTATQLGKLEEDAATTRQVFREGMNAMAERLAALEEAPKGPDRAELYKALAAAQLEIENAEQNVSNEFLKNKYADLASCFNAVRKPLASNGLSIIQLTEDPGSGVLGIRTILAHESGATIEDLITMAPPKMDPQGVGSCRTYMRRYSLMAICGIAGAADDDAEATKKDPNDYERISVAECEKIIYRADELFGDRADAAVRKMLGKVFGGIAVVGDIKAGEADVALNALENAKKLMDKQEAAAKAKEEAAQKEAKAEGGKK
jgi:hypothetical protein